MLSKNYPDLFYLSNFLHKRASLPNLFLLSRILCTCSPPGPLPFVHLRTFSFSYHPTFASSSSSGRLNALCPPRYGQPPPPLTAVSSSCFSFFFSPASRTPALCPSSPYLQPPPRRMHLPLSLCKHTSRYEDAFSVT